MIVYIEDEGRKRLADLQGLFRANPEEGRRVLESVLDGPLTFTPTTLADGARRYLITGKALGAKALFTTASDPNGIRNRSHHIRKTQAKRRLAMISMGCFSASLPSLSAEIRAVVVSVAARWQQAAIRAAEGSDERGPFAASTRDVDLEGRGTRTYEGEQPLQEPNPPGTPVT